MLPMSAGQKRGLGVYRAPPDFETTRGQARHQKKVGKTYNREGPNGRLSTQRGHREKDLVKIGQQVWSTNTLWSEIRRAEIGIQLCWIFGRSQGPYQVPFHKENDLPFLR